MKAIILAAGYSGKSFPLMRERPKSLILVKDKPVVGHIVDKIKELKEIDKIYLVTNDKYKKLFMAWLNDDNVEVVSDGTKDRKEQLGATGSLNFIIKNKNLQEDLLIVAGDNLFDFSLSPLISDRDKIKIGVYDIADLKKATNYGVVKLNGSKLKEFEEKPKQTDSTLISTACYYFPKDSLKFIDSFLDVNEESELGHFIKFLKDKKEIETHKFEGRWFDIGTDSKLRKVRREYS
ncbi:MAG: sugar phosphate nucleotidyltransferase [Candidatus Nanoarchaeia archaeon]|nr:sugar phosphate nucleotidyltransferase [Candidatus Nanoarchaeia archaeon]